MINHQPFYLNSSEKIRLETKSVTPQTKDSRKVRKTNEIKTAFKEQKTFYCGKYNTDNRS